ncbi:MAG: aspartate kinase, partial [Pseudomonadota bacterium]|nr:aspartate kinase [Pseudomonadota bacterium]
MDKSSWKVFKFGGSSLADTECFVRVSRIILDSYYANPDVRHGIVVSAMGGVTDLLIRISENYGSSSLSKSKEYKTINNRLSSIANDLLEKKDVEVFQEIVAGNFDEIEELLGQSNKGKEESLKISNIISGFGELWSAKLLTLYISKLLDDVNEVTFIDSRKIIYLKQGLVGEAVDWKISLKNHKHFESKYKSSIFLITGFIASKENGEPTNLGRNGSDYSAAIFASFFDSKELVIWTDVDGVMSADPKKVKDAKVISNLSYNEAIELAYFGAKVIHPKTLGPLIDKGIPVFIRNTFESEKIGSEISSNNDQNSAIKGITVIDSMALVNIEGTGMMGVPGTADKLFASLKDGEISVALISQASSEHSICIAVPDNLSDLARKLINNAFQNEIDAGLISNVEVKKKQSIIAVVGDNMAGQHGIAGKFFNTLGMAGVNVRAIAQGSSERNISAVVDSIDSEKALNVIHSGFFRTYRVLTIGVIGIGVVGGELLNQIKQNAGKISDQFNCDVHIKAIGASKNMLLSDDPIDLNDWSKKM